MEKQNKPTILVPVDFSEIADFAIEHAIGCSIGFGAKIVLLHVVDSKTKSRLQASGDVKSATNQKLQSLAEKISSKTGHECEFIAREGSIFTTISEVATEIAATFIIMGTHGRHGLQYITGSFAIKVVTSAPCPVLVVQKSPYNKEGYKNIIFPIEKSAQVRQKVKWAIYFCKKFNGVVHFFPKYESDEFFKKRIMPIIKQIKSVFDKNAVPYTDKVSDPKGPAYLKQIFNYSKEKNGDLIIIMTNPDKFLPTFMVSTTDEKIIFNEHKIPVLCVNPKDLDIKIIGL